MRKIELTRVAWGAALLLAPRRMLSSVHRIEVDDRSVLVARVLGLRHLAQAALSGRQPRPEALALGVGVDLVHAATALTLAGVDHRRAPAGLVNAVVSTAWGVAGIRDLRAGAASGQGPGGRREAERHDAHPPGS